MPQIELVVTVMACWWVAPDPKINEKGGQIIQGLTALLSPLS
jgi:hypothetical protein